MKKVSKHRKTIIKLQILWCIILIVEIFRMYKYQDDGVSVEGAFFLLTVIGIILAGCAFKYFNPGKLELSLAAYGCQILAFVMSFGYFMVDDYRTEKLYNERVYQESKLNEIIDFPVYSPEELDECYREVHGPCKRADYEKANEDKRLAIMTANNLIYSKLEGLPTIYIEPHPLDYAAQLLLSLLIPFCLLFLSGLIKIYKSPRDLANIVANVANKNANVFNNVANTNANVQRRFANAANTILTLEEFLLMSKAYKSIDRRNKTNLHKEIKLILSRMPKEEREKYKLARYDKAQLFFDYCSHLFDVIDEKPHEDNGFELIRIERDSGTKEKENEDKRFAR